MGLTVVAAWLPASRAASLDPAAVLRDAGDHA
jgi:ABC-type lipoprotein release transport system permease subunit